jgi:hypothetical protein
MSTPTRRCLSAAAFSLLAVAALMSACDEESTVTPPTPVAPGRLQGAVYQQLNPEVPLAGATLSWGGLTATSAADGSYGIAPEAAGADSLRVSLAGFVAESRWVELGEDDQQQSFALLPFDVTPPPAPLSFGVQSVGGEFLRLFWTAPADSSDLAGYWLTKSPGDPQTQRFDIAVNEWTDLAVAAGRDYSYTLASIDHSGNLSTALDQTAALDAPPLGSALEFLPTGDYGQIPLRWTANREADFGAYRLYRIDAEVTADSLDLLVFTSTDAADTLFTDSAVTANALYSYRLYAFDAAGQAASPLPLSAARGAAQRFAGIDGEARVLAFPTASDRFLLADAVGGRLLLLDGDGIAQDSLTVSESPTSFAPLPDGRLWAAAASGSDQGRLLLLDTDPLSLLREGLVDLQPGAIAWLGGDSLVVAPQPGGAPVLVDALNFLPLDTLDFLADLAVGSRLVADPDAKQLFAVETSGAQRLLRADLSGAPILAESLALVGVPIAFQRDGAGNLLLALLNSSTLLRIAEADFTQQTSITLPAIMSLGRFTADGGEWWGRPSGQTRANGYSLDWSGAAATFLNAYLQVDVPLAMGRLEPDGPIVSLLDNYWLSLCDPARGDSP